MRRSCDAHPAEAGDQAGDPFRAPRTCAHRDLRRSRWPQRRARQRPFGSAPVVHGSGEQMEARFGDQRPLRVDVALPVGHHRDAARLGQHRLGRLRGAEPAFRLLVGQGALVVRDTHPAAPRPHPTRHQPQHRAIVGIHRHHRMQQNAVTREPHLAQPSASLRLGLEVDLAEILDRQHVAIGAGLRCRRAPPLDQPLDGHLPVGQEPSEPHHRPASPLRRPPKAHAAASNDLLQQLGPLFSRRASQNAPSFRLSDMPIPQANRLEESLFADPGQSHPSHRLDRCVHTLGRRPGSRLFCDGWAARVIHGPHGRHGHAKTDSVREVREVRG